MTRISKTLEAILARTAFDTAKSGATHSLRDFLFLEILREEGSLAYQILASRLQDWEIQQVRLRVEQEIAAQPAEGADPATYYKAFAEELCAAAGDVPAVSTAHALLCILSDRTTAAARVLEMFHVTPEVAASEMQRYVGPAEEAPIRVEVRMLEADDRREERDESLRLLEKFGADLTRMAREGRIDPVVGREHEIERVVQILSRRKKNNPILIGEAGVGKSAVVEGLALRIASGDVPCTIAGKTIFSLDVSSLVAGTKFRGEFEERMQQLIDTLRKAKDTIIFIDEIHTIVGAGSTQGSLDTANILKPALARGELQTIGATTLDEYREIIESDPALERRFQRVLVEPATPDQTRLILRGVAPYYERHHKVRYTDEALQACVALTDRYVTDRYFPDKAIDVLDEAGSRVRLAAAREPQELRDASAELERVRGERREAVAAMDYTRAAEARLRELALRTSVEERRAAWLRDAEEHPAQITAEHVAEVITSMTGIPAERVTDGEMDRLRGLRDHLMHLSLIHI